MSNADLCFHFNFIVSFTEAENFDKQSDLVPDITYLQTFCELFIVALAIITTVIVVIVILNTFVAMCSKINYISTHKILTNKLAIELYVSK